MCRVACRDADIVSLGLTAFAALMGDAGAAAGEPLESYRATTESTGVPELSPLGRQAFDLSYWHAVVYTVCASAVQAREGQSVRLRLVFSLCMQLCRRRVREKFDRACFRASRWMNVDVCDRNGASVLWA